MSSTDLSGEGYVVTLLPPVPESTPRARAAVRALLAGTAVENILDLAELCASELVTNAVLHAATTLEFEIRYDPTSVRLRVSDLSHNPPVLSRHSRTASTGRGLAMVAAVADSWGVDQLDGRGKSVWCVLTDHGADAVTLDIADVMDAWELSSAEVPQQHAAPRDQSLTSTVVTLAGYPVDLGLGLQEHYEAVVRECQLLAAPRADEASPLPDRLLGLALALAQRYTEELFDLARPDPRRLAAQARGLASVDLTYEVTPELMARLRTWQQVLDDVDEFSRRGDLLAPMISAPLAGLRTWALREFVRQSAGSSPTPWPGPSAS